MAAGFNLLFAPFFAIYYGFAFLFEENNAYFWFATTKKCRPKGAKNSAFWCKTRCI